MAASAPDVLRTGLRLMSEFDFRECPSCGGYGVRDNGKNCVTCGGSGSNGLRSTDGIIGSGEVIIEVATGRRVSQKEFLKRVTERTGAAQ